MDLRRLPAAVSLAALSLAAALSLGRVFRGSAYLMPIVGAALLPHFIGWCGRALRWSAGAVLTVSTGALMLYLCWAIAGSTTAYGIPTGTTLSRIGHDLGAGWDLWRSAVAPVPVTDGALLLVVIATWLVAQNADWLAFRLDATVGAVVPALVLFIVACALGTRDNWALSTVGFAATAVLFILVHQHDLLERRRAWFASGDGSSSLSLVRAGALFGALAVAFGVVVGPQLPGANAEPLVDYKNLGRQDRDNAIREFKVESPLFTLKDKFLEAPRQDLFTVGLMPATSAPTYYRFAALDHFGRTDKGQEIWSLERPLEDANQALNEKVPATALKQEYRIGALSGFWMPAAFQPIAISPKAIAQVEPDTLTLVAASHQVQGARYRVSSVIPTAPDLEQIAASGAPLPSDFNERRYTELPSDFPAEITQRAQALTADAATPYAKALALEGYLADPNTFTYDLDVPSGHSGSAMLDFLNSKHGYCEQFAGTYAAMMRALGIPARVAVGFTPGFETAPGSGTYDVTNQQAHAWAEVYFANLGWRPFEPTPAAVSPQPGQSATGVLVQPPPTTSTLASPPPSNSVPATPPTPPASRPDATVDPVGTNSNGIMAYWWILLPLVVAALLGAYVFTVLRVRAGRRAGRRDTPDARQAVVGAWQEALDRLSEEGVSRNAALTPVEFAHYVPRAGLAETAAPLATLARTYTVASYAPQTPSADEVVAAWNSVKALDVVLDARLSRTQRWRRVLHPRSLRARR